MGLNELKAFLLIKLNSVPNCGALALLVITCSIQFQGAYWGRTRRLELHRCGRCKQPSIKRCGGFPAMVFYRQIGSIRFLTQSRIPNTLFRYA